MKKVIVFDAVGTLIHPNPPVIEAYFVAGKEYGSQRSREEIRDGFAKFRKTVFAPSEAALPDKPTTSEQTERDKWSRLVQQLFFDVKPIESLFEHLWNHFADADNWHLDGAVDELWSNLRHRKFAIMIASNFDKRLLSIARSLSPLGNADAIFTSAAIGFSKPENQFYLSVQNQMEELLCDSDLEITMVGDDYQRDFLAPRKLGWNSVFIDQTNDYGELNSILNLEELSERID